MKKTAFLLTGLLLVFLPVRSMNGPGMSAAEVEIKQVEPFVYCSMRHKGTFSEMEQVIRNLITTMRGQNVYPQGPMIGIYHTVPGPDDPENMQMEWEMGFPITEQALVQAPLERKIWEHSLVASTLHTGTYEETGETITDVFQWMEAHGYEKAGPVLERYLTEGIPEGRPEDQKTEIWIPCKKK